MKVAFASCCQRSHANQHKQPVWGIIHQQKPDLLLLLGDNVYLGRAGYEMTNLEEKMELLRRRYDVQLNEPHLKELLADTHFLAVWDNHDFGLPGDIYGAEVNQEFRDASRKIFNSFIKSKSKSLEPPSSTIYCTHTREDENGKKIKFFMLDLRSMQDNPHLNFPGRHLHTLLGEEQEEWLLTGLEQSTADINVICSGIPFSYWRNYRRWYKAFKKVAAKKNKLLFLAGQVHHNSIYTHELKNIIINDPHIPGGHINLENPTVDGVIVEKKIMFEAISSGVGQSFNKPDEGEDQEDTLFRNNPDFNENTGLEGKPRNNYGIIDFTNDEVLITLHGQFVDDLHYVKIDRNNWTRKGYWSMRR